jgi:hypothetical protein
MNQENTPSQPEFYTLVMNAVHEGIQLVRDIEKNKHYIGTHFDWPKVSYSKNGFPTFSKTVLGGPIDYTGAFVGIGQKARIQTDTLESFQKVLEFARNNSRIKSHFGPPDQEDYDEEHHPLRPMLFSTIISLIDRYIHVYGEKEFNENDFSEIYLPIERGIFDNELIIDFAIPMLYMKCEFEIMTLSSIHNVMIIQMSDKFQEARMFNTKYEQGIHEYVIGSATHLLVIGNWVIKNDNYLTRSNILHHLSAYPIDRVDKFFAALRIVTGYDAGYGQIIIHHKDWARRYEYTSPGITVKNMRSYPAFFEEDPYHRDGSILTAEQAKSVGEVFDKLLETSANEILVAIRRLNLCFLRESDEDSILDATIALEALVGGNDHQEITHKLALRIAILSRLEDDNESPQEVFRAIKKIYAYRSAVVHGSSKADKSREIIVQDKPPIRTVSLAIKYLRMTLRILLKYPQYLKAEKIDELIFSSIPK